jgi:hypothetical protein
MVLRKQRQRQARIGVERWGAQRARDSESEGKSHIDESDDAAGEVDDAHDERRTIIANKAIAALEAPIDPGARPRRLGVGGVNYSK